MRYWIARWRWRLGRWRRGEFDRYGPTLGYWLPGWLKYWAMNDLVAKASIGEYAGDNVTDLRAVEVLMRTGQALGWDGYAD